MLISRDTRESVDYIGDLYPHYTYNGLYYKQDRRKFPPKSTTKPIEWQLCTNRGA